MPGEFLGASWIQQPFRWVVKKQGTSVFSEMPKFILTIFIQPSLLIPSASQGMMDLVPWSCVNLPPPQPNRVRPSRVRITTMDAAWLHLDVTGCGERYVGITPLTHRVRPSRLRNATM